MEQASKMEIGVGLLMEKNLHTETSRKMAVLKINDPEYRRLVEIELEAIKVNMDLEMTPKTTRVFLVWESSKPWLE